MSKYYSMLYKSMIVMDVESATIELV